MADDPSKALQIDLRASFSAVRDQGARGTCAAFAVTAAHEATRVSSGITSVNTEDLCEEVLYWGALQAMGYASNNGISLSAASTALGQPGQPLEALWPYDDTRDALDPGYVPPPAAVAPGNCFQAPLTSIPFSVNAVLSQLSSGHPVVVGVRASRAFVRAQGGRIPPPAPGDSGDGHAILIVGYDGLDTSDEGGTFVFRNSWGEDWGDQGYGYLSARCLEQIRLGLYVWTIK